jgi:endo-1,4-beta-mannosidase
MITQTPKEKAEELVEMFMNIKQQKLSDYSIIYYPTAKQCALIAVAEIMKVYEQAVKMNFWKAVKEEIINL